VRVILALFPFLLMCLYLLFELRDVIFCALRIDLQVGMLGFVWIAVYILLLLGLYIQGYLKFLSRTKLKSLCHSLLCSVFYVFFSIYKPL